MRAFRTNTIIPCGQLNDIFFAWISTWCEQNSDLSSVKQENEQGVATAAPVSIHGGKKNLNKKNRRLQHSHVPPPDVVLYIKYQLKLFAKFQSWFLFCGREI